MAPEAPTSVRRSEALPVTGTGGKTASLFLVPFFALFAVAIIAPSSIR